MDYPKVYKAVYDLHKRYFPCPRTLDEYAQAVDELVKTERLFQSHPFAVDLLRAVYAEWERAEQAQKEGTAN